jgi:hypothetical protein
MFTNKMVKILRLIQMSAKNHQINKNDKTGASVTYACKGSTYRVWYECLQQTHLLSWQNNIKMDFEERLRGLGL